MLIASNLIKGFFSQTVIQLWRPLEINRTVNFFFKDTLPLKLPAARRQRPVRPFKYEPKHAGLQGTKSICDINLFIYSEKDTNVMEVKQIYIRFPPFLFLASEMLQGGVLL